MIKIDDRVRYRAIEGEYAPDRNTHPATVVSVIAYVTAVHDKDTIDIGWRGDGGVHPDDLGRSHLEVHRRLCVSRSGVAPHGSYHGDGVTLQPWTLWESVP